MQAQSGYTTTGRWRAYRVGVSFCAIFVLCSCMKSPPPSVSDLIPITAPAFSGANNKGIINTPSHTAVVQGSCDPKTFTLEYSTDNSTWTQIAGGCPTGQFSVSVAVPQYTNIYARAHSKLSTTSTAHALVRYLLPPTSPSLTLVNTSSSDDSSLTQNASGSVDGVTLQSASQIVTTYLPGVTFEP